MKRVGLKNTKERHRLILNVLNSLYGSYDFEAGERKSPYDNFYVEVAWKVKNPSNEQRYENFCSDYHKLLRDSLSPIHPWDSRS